MKALILALVAALPLTLSSFAQASESPVIASVVTSGGMMAPGHINTYRLDVLANGQVVSTNPRVREQVVAKLAVATVEKIKKDIEAMPSEVKLVEPKGTIHCMDAPGTSFTVIKSSGKAVEIGAIQQCVELESPDYVPNQNELMTVLKGLEMLSRI